MTARPRRRNTTARDLAEEVMLNLGMDPAALERLFAGATADFPVVISERLPFGVDRAGMYGITLRRRVFITDRAAELPPVDLLVLLRHEAEHVSQQMRAPWTFYVSYGLSWLWGFLRAGGGGGIRERWYRAYRAIPAELAAVAAAERLRQQLLRVGPGAPGAG